MLERLFGRARRRSSVSQEEDGLSSPLTPISRLGSPVIGRSHSRKPSSVQVLIEDARLKWAFYILGAATLLSWNAVITAIPYFLSRLEGSRLKTTFSSYLSSVFNLTGIIALAHATASAKTVHPSTRIRPQILMLASCMFLFASSTFMSSSPAPFFAFVLLNSSLQAALGAYFQTGVIALSSLFGPYAIQAVFAGQAAVAVAVSITQYITSAFAIAAQRHRTSDPGGVDAPPSDSAADASRASTSAFVFFTTSTAFLMVALGVYMWMTKLPFYVETVRNAKNIQQYQALVQETEHDIDEDVSVEIPTEDRHLLAVNVEAHASEPLSIWKVARINVAYNFSVAYVFIVTLAVFPPITASIQSTHKVSMDALSIFSPILFNALHFLVFNVGDYLGRVLCSYPQLLIWSRRRLLAFSLARTAFIPFFLACNLQRPQPPNPPAIDAAAAPLINSDTLYLFGLLLFGMTNGYGATASIMAASSTEHNQRLKKSQIELAATIAQFCLVGGLALGSLTSFAVRGSICGCNPFKD